MKYDYKCSSCGFTFDRRLGMAQRDQPLKEKCLKCGKLKTIKRVFGAPSISYDMIHPAKRAGSGWNDLLAKIAKYNGGRRTTIEHY